MLCFYAHAGCHSDPNCASQTGVSAYNAAECCALKNRRSYRDLHDPDGRCVHCGGGMYAHTHMHTYTHTHTHTHKQTTHTNNKHTHTNNKHTHK